MVIDSISYYKQSATFGEDLVLFLRLAKVFRTEQMPLRRDFEAVLASGLTAI